MHGRLEKVKIHFQENKDIYITIVVCAVLAVLHECLRDGTEINNSNNAEPVFYNNPVINIYNSNDSDFGGYSTKIVQHDRTEDTYLTVKDAAASANVTPSEMSRHLNGHREHLNGETYSIIGQGTTG